MGIDINAEVMRAGDIMSRHRMSRDDQIEVVKIIMACGVEHCLNEQERVRDDKDAILKQVFAGSLVH